MGRPSVYLRSASMPYEQLGSGVISGVWPEDVKTVHGPNGPEQASYTLRRNPGQTWPDMLPYTPNVAFDDGLVSWTGRTQETPTKRGGSDDQIEAMCEGWLAHLSDDAIRLRLVNNDMSGWVDARSLGSGVSLTTWTGSYDVTTGGTPSISATRGAATGALGGIAFDAGPGCSWKKLTLTWIGGGAANMELRAAGGDTIGALTEVGFPDPTPIATVTTTTTITFTTPRRYIYVYAAATGVIAAADTAWVQLTNLILYSESGFESGNASILKASDVLARVLPYAPLLNQSIADIAATSFNIPHFDRDFETPRETIEAANSYHLWQYKLQDDSAGGQPRLRFRAVPTIPTLLARVGAGIEFSDASRNDGGDIYNRVIVRFQDAGGNDTWAARTTAQALGGLASYDTLSAVAAGPNPGFETAGGPPPTGWATTLGTLTRDTAVFDSGAASGRVTTQGAGSFQGSTTITGLTPGRAYQLAYRVRANAAWLAGGALVQAWDGTQTNISVGVTFDSFTNAIGVAFSTRSIVFVPQSSSALILLSVLAGTPSVDTFYIDGLTLREARPTIPDKQGFTRTKQLVTGSKLTVAAANQIGDAFLLAHMTSPLRGTLTVTGASIVDLVSGNPIPVGMLGRYVGDAILLDEGDPDTGAQGRVGIIAAIGECSHAANTCTIAIDSRKDFVDAFLARVNLFQGGT